MPKFCPNCGKDITEKVKFCPDCGADIDSFSVKKDEKSIVEEPKQEIKFDNAQKIEETKIENKIEETKIGKKYSSSDMIIQGILGVIIFIILLAIVSHLSAPYNNAESAIVSGASGANQGKISTQSTINSQVNFIPTPTESPTDRNIRIANEIVADYHKTHTYTMNDYYVCIDMANDVWDMLKTQGINAKIMIGRVDYAPTKITDSNHAWVLAEVAPDQWLALEATGGYSVSKSDNPLYYQGYPFFDPKQTKTYVQLNQQLSDAQQKYNTAVTDYNQYLAQYNQAGIFSKISMKSILDNKELIVQQRLNDYNQVINQINSLTAFL